MEVTVIGSHLCPDTLYALNQLTAAGISVSFKDILSCHSDLKEYLKLRDTNPAYDEIRGTDRLGVPCIIREDGTLTFDVAEIL